MKYNESARVPPDPSGVHLLVDVWSAKNLGNETVLREMLEEGVTNSGARIIDLNLHRFEDNAGLAGIVVLAQSHISIHSWPEHDYAAIDIFTCGDINPYKILEVIRRVLEPKRIKIFEYKRGISE